jgi:glucose-6-phosphate 1-epimerase
MPPNDWRHMVCVEAARVERPVALAPGQCWAGEQHLELRDM